MHQMVQTIRQIARHELEQQWGANLAVVKSVFGTNGTQEYACTVQLRESGIVLPHVPIATGVIGMASLPRENDLVLVMFAGGDLHAPVIVGRLYSEAVAPPTHGPGELVTVLPGDETSADKRLELRITTPGDGTRALKLTLDGSVKVELIVDDTGVQVQAGDATLKVTQTGSSDGTVELATSGAKLTIEQGGDVTLEAQGTLTLKATKIDIKGDAQVSIGGQIIKLN